MLSQNATQQCVHLTGGNLRHFGQVSGLKTGSVIAALSFSTSQQVTQTVSSFTKVKDFEINNQYTVQ
jgi:hypothetical protein